MKNRERAACAKVAVDAFAKRTGLDPNDDMAMNLSDLVSDLMHLADTHGLDWLEDIVRRADMHYEAEVSEEKEEMETPNDG